MPNLLRAEFIDTKLDWSLRTFGPGLRTKGICNHIRKELLEVEANPTDLSEWVDIILLALDGAARAGYTGRQVLDEVIIKQVQNVNRKWPPVGQSEDEAVEHIRE